MLKITLYRDEQPARMVLEGKLAGAWVEEARDVWRNLPKSAGGASMIVDLKAIDYVDGGGKELLATMWREGATLQAAGCCTKYIIEEISKTGRASACPGTDG
jgi:hypothetical protein